MSLINRLLNSLDSRKNAALENPTWNALNELKPVLEKAMVPGFQKWAYLGFLSSIIGGAVLTMVYLDRLAEEARMQAPIAQKMPQSFPPGQIVRDDMLQNVQSAPTVLAMNQAVVPTPAEKPLALPQPGASIAPAINALPETTQRIKESIAADVKQVPKPSPTRDAIQKKPTQPSVVNMAERTVSVIKNKTPPKERVIASSVSTVTKSTLPEKKAQAPVTERTVATPAPTQTTDKQEIAKRVEDEVRALDKTTGDAIVIEAVDVSKAPAARANIAIADITSQEKTADATAIGREVKKKAGAQNAVTRKDLALSNEQQALVSYEKAAHLLTSGRLAEAEQGFRDTLTKNDKHRNARVALAGVLFDSGRSAEASKILSEGTRLEPSYLPYVIWQAKIMAENGVPGAALELLVQHFSNDVADPEYLSFMAGLFQATGKNEEAIIYYQKALSYAPFDGKTWVGMAISQEGQKNWVEAQIAYTRALNDNTLDAQLINFSQKRLAFVRLNVPFASN